MMSGNLWQHKVLNPAVQPTDEDLPKRSAVAERFLIKKEELPYEQTLLFF